MSCGAPASCPGGRRAWPFSGVLPLMHTWVGLPGAYSMVAWIGLTGVGGVGEKVARLLDGLLGEIGGCRVLSNIA